MASVFISYRRGAWHAEIQQLASDLEAALASRGGGAVFFDAMIAPGQQWYQRIVRNLRSAELVLVCVEQDFWRSPFCVGEVVELLERMDRGEEFTVLPVTLSAVDASDLSPDCQRLYTWLRQFEGIDARYGLNEPAVRSRITEAAVGVLVGRTLTLAAKRNAPAQALAALLEQVFSTAELRHLLSDNHELRHLARHLQWESTHSQLVDDLVHLLLDRPDFALRLLYKVRQVVPARHPEVDSTIALWRDHEAAFLAIRPTDAERVLFDVLCDALSRRVLSPESIPGFPRLPDLPRSCMRDQALEWCRFLLGRDLVILPFLDCLVHATGARQQEAIARLRQAVPVPPRRERLASLLLDLAGEDPHTMRSRMMGEERSAKIISALRHPCAPWDLARGFVELADLNGVIDEAFFARLLLFARGREADVRSLASAWGLVAGDPTERFWRDRLVLLLEDCFNADDLFIFFRSDWRVPNALMIEQGVSAEILSRHVLAICERHGMPVRSILAELERKRPGTAREIRLVEHALLSEEDGFSSMLSLVDFQDRIPDPASHHPLACFLLTAFDGFELRQLAAYLTGNENWLPTFPTTRGVLADEIIKEITQRAQMDELVGSLYEQRPNRSEEVTAAAAAAGLPSKLAP